MYIPIFLYYDLSNELRKIRYEYNYIVTYAGISEDITTLLYPNIDNKENYTFDDNIVFDANTLVKTFRDISTYTTNAVKDYTKFSDISKNTVSHIFNSYNDPAINRFELVGRNIIDKTSDKISDVIDKYRTFKTFLTLASYEVKYQYNDNTVGTFFTAIRTSNTISNFLGNFVVSTLIYKPIEISYLDEFKPITIKLANKLGFFNNDPHSMFKPMGNHRAITSLKGGITPQKIGNFIRYAKVDRNLTYVKPFSQKTIWYGIGKPLISNGREVINVCRIPNVSGAVFSVIALGLTSFEFAVNIMRCQS